MRFFAVAMRAMLTAIMKKQAVLLAILVSLVAAVGNAQDDPLAPVRFLAGKWSYVSSGKAGEPTGSTTFSSSLGNKVMVRNGVAKYPAAAGRAAYTHEDMTVIYAQPGAIRADYYDNAGNVAKYTVSSPAANYVIFTSDKVKGQPRARLSYKKEANGTVTVYYEAAPANDQDKFAGYAAWSMKK